MGEEGDTAKSTVENLQRKIQVLEEELDNAEKHLKETVEKYVLFLFFVDLRLQNIVVLDLDFFWI